LSDHNESDSWGISEPPEIRTPDGELIKPRMSYATGAGGCNMILRSGKWEHYCRTNYLGGGPFFSCVEFLDETDNSVYTCSSDERVWVAYMPATRKPSTLATEEPSMPAVRETSRSGVIGALARILGF